MNDLVDRRGIAFHDYRKSLPTLARDFPPPNIVKDRKLLSDLHAEWDRCFVCGRERRRLYGGLELHHLIGGSRGRSDERCNLMPLCRECHGNANTKAIPFARLLWLKHFHDPENTDWVRLAILARKFLPTPLP